MPRGLYYRGTGGGDIAYTGSDGETYIISAPTNENINIIPHGTGITVIGNAGTSNRCTANDDLYVSGVLEVDGDFYADSYSYFTTAAFFQNNVRAVFGSNRFTSNSLFKQTNTDPDQLTMALEDATNALCIGNATNGAAELDYGHAGQTDSTIFLHASDNSDVTKHDILCWNNHSIGAGNGSFCGIKSIAEEVTISVGAGNTPVVETSGNLAPANALIFGATARITDAPGGGATTVDIGVTGSGNLDTLVDGMSTALNTTATSPADGDGTQLPLINAAAATLTLTTDADVTGDEMKVRVSVFYIDFTPPTS